MHSICVTYTRPTTAKLCVWNVLNAHQSRIKLMYANACQVLTLYLNVLLLCILHHIYSTMYGAQRQQVKRQRRPTATQCTRRSCSKTVLINFIECNLIQCDALLFHAHIIRSRYAAFFYSFLYVQIIKFNILKRINVNSYSMWSNNSFHGVREEMFRRHKN